MEPLESCFPAMQFYLMIGEGFPRCGFWDKVGEGGTMGCRWMFVDRLGYHQ